MKYASLTLHVAMILVAGFVVWRGSKAAGDRERQPADSNDVVVAIAVVGLTIVICLMAVTLSVLA